MDFQLKEMYKVYTLTFQASRLTVDQPFLFLPPVPLHPALPCPLRLEMW